jgi:hypothetical protein
MTGIATAALFCFGERMSSSRTAAKSASTLDAKSLTSFVGKP